MGAVQPCELLSSGTYSLLSMGYPWMPCHTMPCHALSLANLYLPPTDCYLYLLSRVQCVAPLSLGTRKICNRLDCPTPRLRTSHPIPSHPHGTFSFLARGEWV